MTNFRVLIVLPDLPLSGAATRTVHLARQLVVKGDEVTLLVLRDRIADSLARRLAADGVHVSTPSRRHLRSWPLPSRRGERPALVHAAMPTAGLAGLAIARRRGLPLVYSVTNSLHIDRPFRRESPRDRLKIVLEHHLIERADALHAVSAGIAAQIVRRYPGARPRVHTIVHPPTEPLSDPHPVPVPAAATPRLLCIGRLVDHKRVADAIEATALLRTTHPSVHLAVLGTGPLLPELRSLIDARRLTGHVTIVGESTNPAGWFDWSDVLVHPSIYEGYPRVVAEAISYGVPIVCTCSAGAPTDEGVQHARPLDPAALRAAVLRAIRSGRTPYREQVEIGEPRLRHLYRLVTGTQTRIHRPP